MMASQAIDANVVGIIGDSWVAHQQLDSLIVAAFGAKGKDITVVSSGHSGAPTKRIYQNIFAPTSNNYSSQSVFAAKPKYIIVIAGVNDSFGQLGSHFYAHHLTLIIETIQKKRCYPCSFGTS